MILNPQERPWIVYSGTELKGKRSTRQIKFPGPISVLVSMILVTITWHYGLNITDVSIFADIYRLNWQFNQHIYRYWDGSAVNTLGLVQEISLSANLLKVHIPIVLSFISYVNIETMETNRNWPLDSKPLLPNQVSIFFFWFSSHCLISS